MLPIAANTTLNPAQIALATETMLYIAHIDGARSAEETALIRAFYDDCSKEEKLPPFEPLLAKAATAPKISSVEFADDAHKDLVLSSCLLVAYADGELSAAEKAAVLNLARQMGVDDARVERLLGQVRDHLLAQLSRLPDAESVARVAGELR